MGRIHDVNVERLNELFGAGKDDYKKVNLNEKLLGELKEKHPGRVYFRNGIPENFLDESVPGDTFFSFEEAYHQLMVDLTDLTAESVRLIIPENDRVRNLFISGGFSKNPLFIRMMASHFPEKKVQTSEVANATSLGAAMIIWKSVDPDFSAPVDLGIR